MGLAIGAGIASSIPTTEAEKKVFGETSDFIRDTVTEKAAHVKDMADAALQEAKAQGLTPEAAGKALHTLGEKVGAIGQAATGHPGKVRGTRIFLEVGVRRVECRRCGKVKQESLQTAGRRAYADDHATRKPAGIRAAGLSFALTLG
jgi:hypothetical protein